MATWSRGSVTCTWARIRGWEQKRLQDEQGKVPRLVKKLVVARSCAAKAARRFQSDIRRVHWSEGENNSNVA